MKRGIPEQLKVEKQSVPKVRTFGTTRKNIVFSFEILERTEYFNLDGTCQNWASDMLDMCRKVSRHTVTEISSGQFRTFRFHSHENAHCPSPLPEGVELKDVYQLRISTSKGGIHGVLVDNCFYVIWLDPLHNMYPDPRFGGLRKVSTPGSCCKDRDDEILRLRDELANVKEENAILNGLLEEAQT